MTALDVPTTRTFEFVSKHVPSLPCRILEVGCGDGELASVLQTAGHAVIALDSSPESVARARARGVDARVCSWPEFSDEPFDAVVFSRSLHHMHDLDASLRRARGLLVRGGAVLVDDFAFSETVAADVTWFYSMLSDLIASALQFAPDATLIQNILRHHGAMAAWQTDHDETLHDAYAMESALRRCVGATTVAHVPYMYRYVAAAISGNSDPSAVVTRVLGEETRAAQLGRLTLLGRQFVARIAT